MVETNLAELRRKALARVPVEMSATTELRMISLRGLDDASCSTRQRNKPVTDEIRYLAGLQRVQYLFVDTDNRDIVLAGPAEGWKVDAGKCRRDFDRPARFAARRSGRRAAFGRRGA